MKSYPHPDIGHMRTFEASHRNLGDCRNVSYTEMWKKFQILYGSEYREHELRQMHRTWINARAKAEHV